MMNLKKTCIALCCSMAVFLTACNDDDGERFYGQPAPLYLSEQPYQKDTLQNAESIKVMRYKMQGVNNKHVEATALVMYPKMARPADGWRVVVWEHGTVGSGDSCAPSNNNLHVRFKPLAEELLSKGYVIVAPDYEGLGVKGVHTYLHLESAANAAIYAVKAFSQQHGKHFNGAWSSVGQSQGGHASLGTAEFADDLNMNYKAAVAAAPASSLGYIIGTIAPAALLQLSLGEQANLVPKGSARDVYAELLAYAAYVGVGITAYKPDFKYLDIFEQRSQPFVAQAEGSTGDNGLCLDELMSAFKNDIDAFTVANPDKTAADYPGLKKGFEQIPEVAEFLNVNQPATKKINVPVMIIQGEKDMAVPVQVTEQLKMKLEGFGTVVDWQMVPGASHTAAIVQRQNELVSFIEKHMPAK
jgi:pimeloyl-ACP methyl ester carboxylesterase